MYNEFIYKNFNQIFKSSNQLELDKIQNIVEAINNKEGEIKFYTEADFKERHLILKKMLKMKLLTLIAFYQKVLHL